MKFITFNLTVRQARALLYAVDNILEAGSDRDVLDFFGCAAQVAVAKRGRKRMGDALRKAKR